MSVSYGQLKESGFNPLFLSNPQWVWLLPLTVLASWCQIGCRISKDHILTCYVHMHKEAIPSLSLFFRVRNHVLIDLLKQTIVQNWVTCSLRNQIYKRKKSHKLAKIDMINHWSCGGLIIHWKHKVSVGKKIVKEDIERMWYDKKKLSSRKWKNGEFRIPWKVNKFWEAINQNKTRGPSLFLC